MKLQNIKNISRKIQGQALYTPGKYRNCDDLERFASGIDNLNLKEYIDENKLQLENMNLIEKEERVGAALVPEVIETKPDVITGGTIQDILTFIKNKLREISQELMAKIRELPQEALSSLKRVLPCSGY